MKKFLTALIFEAGFAKLAYLVLAILFLFGKGDFYNYLSSASIGIFVYVNANTILKYIKGRITN